MIGIYCRVSTSDKNQDINLQLHDLKAYAQARGWSDVQVYSDEGISGSKDSRPALNRLMDDCKKGRIKTILVWRLDRFSRSLKHLINTLDELERVGVCFVSFKENIDLGSPTGRLMVQLLAAFSEFERNIIRERVRAGLENAKRKGKVLGAKKKPLDLDRVRELKGKGYSLRAIAKEMGVSTETIRRRG